MGARRALITPSEREVTQLQKTDGKVGTGNEAASGQRVTVHYTGGCTTKRSPITRGASSTARATATSRSTSASAPAK
jgi:hypothetical protein